MTKISIAFLAALSLVGFGCRKSKPDVDRDAVIAKLTQLKDEMCTCKDKACSDKVSDEYSTWSQAQLKPDNDRAGAPADQDKKLEELTEELTQCLLKLEVPSRGGAAPGSTGGTTGSDNPATGSADGSAAGSAH